MLCTALDWFSIKLLQEYSESLSTQSTWTSWRVSHLLYMKTLQIDVSISVASRYNNMRALFQSSYSF